MSKPSLQSSHKKILLLVSVPPYQSIVQQIAGDSFKVITVVPPNADPHTYEPTARQLSEIAEGRLWFQIGEPFEKKLLPLLPKAEPLDLRQGLAMIQNHDPHHSCCAHAHGDDMDRHIWLSPKMVAIQINTIAAALSERYPEQKEGFESRKGPLHEQLVDLNQEIELRLHNTVTRSFLISHPAFAYFCRDYGCNQLSIEQEGKEPRPKELEVLLASAVQSGARLAIAIPQHNNKGAQLIADKLKIPVRVLDPYANDYMETMRKLAGLIENPYQTDNSL
jgi:zinc transport system substrate-binding protein